ncbi:MAG: HAD-IA family hydrolase [Vicinamibacterales bacterium]
MIELVVFDLDGTLVDSHQDLAFAANALVVELGGAGVSEAAVVKMVGEGAAVLVRRALTASGLDPEMPGALDRFLAIYDGCLLDRTRPYPGTVEMLDQLAPMARLAVLTNKPAHATARMLDGLELSRFFDPIVGGDTPFGRKPNPAGLHHIVTATGASPATTIMVGDSPVDRQTARNAGTGICLVRYGFGFSFGPGDLDGTETIVDGPGEIVGVVKDPTS